MQPDKSEFHSLRLKVFPFFRSLLKWRNRKGPPAVTYFPTASPVQYRQR